MIKTWKIAGKFAGSRRRTVRRSIFAIVLGITYAGSAVAAEISILKYEGCGCCDNWAEHLRGHDHDVELKAVNNMTEVKDKAKVPVALRSCHTAVVEGYVIEGHVPASDIERLLRERPGAQGLAVAGMPTGSPGMENGDRVDPYDVILFRADGTTEVFSHHTEKQ